MKTPTKTDKMSSERDRLNEVFRSAIVDKEVENLKERQTKIRHLERALSGKTIIRGN